MTYKDLNIPPETAEAIAGVIVLLYALQPEAVPQELLYASIALLFGDTAAKRVAGRSKKGDEKN